MDKTKRNALEPSHKDTGAIVCRPDIEQMVHMPKVMFNLDNKLLSYTPDIRFEDAFFTYIPLPRKEGEELRFAYIVISRKYWKQEEIMMTDENRKRLKIEKMLMQAREDMKLEDLGAWIAENFDFKTENKNEDTQKI